MLICLVLCAAAVLPTAFSERPEAQNVQAHPGRNNEIGRRMPAGYATVARNQGLLRLQKHEGGQGPEIMEDTIPSLSDVYLGLWSRNPFALSAALDPDYESESLEKIDRSLDHIGGGHLLRRDAILDSIGGGHLLKRENGFRALDPIGGGHLLKRGFEPRQLDAIGGGHLLKRDPLDAIGGGHLLKRDPLDAIGGGHLLKRALDSIGGGNLLKRDYDRRQLDAIGGGHLLKRGTEGKLGFERIARNGRDFDTLLGRSFGTSKRDTRGAFKRNFDEIDNAGFKDYLYKRNFDEIDSAGFKDDLNKRNFDEIDNAGFQDYLHKRNFDEIDNAGFKDYLFKRNFDEIDNAGFRDYLYKRNLAEGYYPDGRSERVICTVEGCLYKKVAPINSGPKY